MDDIEEKRVYDARTGSRDAYVATAEGLARVAVSGDRTGGFELVHREAARDVAARSSPDGRNGALAVATAADVLVGRGLEPTGFGPAVAVGFDGEAVAAGPAGRVARLVDGEWRETGRITDVRAVEGGLVAAADGVRRTDGTQVGLDDARDVAAAGPFAATGEGLYRLGNGWISVRDGVFEVVAADGQRAHAATADALYGRTGDGWDAVEVPVDAPVADVAYGDGVYAVTATGQFLASGDGRRAWRHSPLGLSGVAALAVA